MTWFLYFYVTATPASMQSFPSQFISENACEKAGKQVDEKLAGRVTFFCVGIENQQLITEERT
ncbi:MAG: hypothetical protein DI589_11210 [Shinella sp.]|nr:MAG: hypothetical protein DI589_11210 [Shinella sp.]